MIFYIMISRLYRLKALLLLGCPSITSFYGIFGQIRSPSGGDKWAKWRVILPVLANTGIINLLYPLPLLGCPTMSPYTTSTTYIYLRENTINKINKWLYPFQGANPLE